MSALLKVRDTIAFDNIAYFDCIDKPKTDLFLVSPMLMFLSGSKMLKSLTQTHDMIAYALVNVM